MEWNKKPASSNERERKRTHEKRHRISNFFGDICWLPFTCIQIHKYNAANTVFTFYLTKKRYIQLVACRIYLLFCFLLFFFLCFSRYYFSSLTKTSNKILVRLKVSVCVPKCNKQYNMCYVCAEFAIFLLLFLIFSSFLVIAVSHYSAL